MACGSEKRTVGTGLFGLVVNIAVTFYRGKAALTAATPFSLLGGILRALAAVENMERCAELQGINVDELRRQREQLQHEVETLQRALEQQQSQQGAH